MAYDEKFQAAALIRLAENHNDYHLTAQEVGCSVQSLRNWERNQSKPKNTNIFVQKKEDTLSVADYLEEAVKHMLKNPPNELKGDAWAITVGVLMDKWLLVKGQPTERTETISRLIEKLPEHERNYVYERAQEIIRGTGRTSGLSRN